MTKKSIKEGTTKKDGIDLLYRTLNSRKEIKAGADRFGRFGEDYTRITQVREFSSDHWYIIEIEISGETNRDYKTYIYAVEHKGKTWFHMSSSKIIFKELADGGKVIEFLEGE